MPIYQRILAVTLYTLSLTSLPIALTFAVLRHRLWDIDVVLNRGLVYGGLTASIVALYGVFVGGLSAVFHAQGSGWVVFAGAALAALLFQPLRAWLQRLANRLLYGHRDEPYAVLAGFGRQLEATGALEATLAALAGTIQRALKLPYVGLEAQGIAGQPGTAAPAGRRQLIDIPLVYQDETVGRLRVAPRDGESTLSGADRRLLEDLARQAAVAVHAARVTAALRVARERLVSSQEEERRRLRRDLHDGLGPALAALAAQAEAARDLIETQPETSRSLLADLIAQAQAATADIRRLVYNLRPPALDDLGLLGAIQAQAQKISQAHALTVNVLAGPLPALPAAVEVAAYRVVQEALANVVRHAAAKHCRVSLAVESGYLALEIADDGRGLPANLEAGVGLTSMRERTEELGGVYAITGGPHGTQVTAALPLTPLTNA
jgi:signal transduction histidine kinase